MNQPLQEINQLAGSVARKTIARIAMALAGISGVAMIVMLVMLMIGMTGCSATPSQRWGATTLAYNTALATASDLRQQGYIDDEQYNDIQRVRVPVSLAIDQTYQSLIDDDQEQAKHWAIKAEEYLARFAAVLAGFEDKRTGFEETDSQQPSTINNGASP